MRQLARLLAESFPSVDPQTARDYLDEFFVQGVPWQRIYATGLPGTLCQGDIIGPLSFIIEDKETEGLLELDSPAVVLSHSCDADNDKHLVFAACRPLHDFRNHRSLSDIMNNTFYGAMTLRQVPTLGDSVLDFGIVQSFATSRILIGLEGGRLKRFSSFTQLGHYYFIAKLTVRFFRATPPDEGRLTFQSPHLMQRLRHFLDGQRSLLNYLFKADKEPNS